MHRRQGEFSQSTHLGAAPGSVAVPYPSIFRMADRVDLSMNPGAWISVEHAGAGAPTGGGSVRPER